jgi:hypothetical protein
MQIKNLIIGLLVATNALCLAIVIRQATHTQSNKNDTLVPYDKATLPSFKEDLVIFYNPSRTTCGAAVSLSKRSPLAGTTRLEMACLLHGSRHVVWGTLKGVQAELSNEYVDFVRLASAENIKEIDGVSYRPEGERNALLFAKQNLLNEQSDSPSNDYLQGYLLGYDEKDIEFFYQRWDFFGYLQTNKKIAEDFLRPFSYEEFSPELKKEFEIYKTKVWPPTSERHSKYENDKKDAFRWVEENKQYSNEQLYEQIEKLKIRKA